MPYISGRKFQIKTIMSSRISQPPPVMVQSRISQQVISNKRLKQFVHSRFQLQTDQVILCLKSSVNQQRLFAYKNLEGTYSGVYFKCFKSFMPTHIGKKAPD